MKKKKKTKQMYSVRSNAVAVHSELSCCCCIEQCNKKRKQHRRNTSTGNDKYIFKRMNEKAKAQKENEKKRPNHTLHNIYDTIHTYIFIYLFHVVRLLFTSHTSTRSRIHWLTGLKIYICVLVDRIII